MHGSKDLKDPQGSTFLLMIIIHFVAKDLARVRAGVPRAISHEPGGEPRVNYKAIIY